VAPADRFRLPDGTVFGIISSTTQPFCATCDRSRLTADGMWLRCLYAMTGTDLRSPLRSGASDDELRDLISATWRQRRDRGAVDRLSGRATGQVFVSLESLKLDPHLEMHTRGG
jgi:cyclic pyranopterin phosphate synthase